MALINRETHSSRLYLENFLQYAPYRNIKTGMGARSKLNPASTVKPHPYPSVSTRGAVVSGKNVPMRHRVTITPVMAEAEKSPNASTT